ncbi:unnamed protein product [Schistosoma curassoni]|nr:unnamed protein product [Schistosoma curassoni]
MHTTQKRYCTQNQPTTVTIDSSVNEMENEDWNRFLENDFTKFMGITSRQNYPFNDQSIIYNPNDTSTTSNIINNNNIPITYKMNDNNKSGSVNKNILGHVKELRENCSNDSNLEITPNCDCSDNDLSWTKDVFNSKHYTTSSLALTSGFINDTKIQNNHPVSNEFISGEDYQQSNYLYDQHFNSTPVQLCSQTDYSVVRTVNYPYIINNEHPHYLSEYIQSSDTEYSNYHNNLHIDLRSNVSDFTDISIASDPDYQNQSKSKAKSSFMFLNDHLCAPQAPTIENLKSCNPLSQEDSFENGWLDGQNRTHYCANWSVDWTNNTESNSRPNYHSCNSKHIPINFDSFRCLDTGSEVPIPNAFNLSSGAYFWLYNSQCKGPKASPLISLTNTMILNNSAEDDQSSLTENCTSSVYQDDFVSSSASSRVINPVIHYPISPLSLPGYPFVVFEDPVQRRYDLVHCSKLRRGDGNDVTPNLMRLRSMGEELAHLNRNITAQGELIATGASSVLDQPDMNLDFKVIQDLSGRIFNSKIVEQAKREKNKLASKICRLKKKAFHEANKIKYLGLEIEYNELASVIVKIKELITKALKNNLPSENLRYELANQQHFYMSENQLNKVDLSSTSSSHAGSIALTQSTVKLFPNISGSVFKQALVFYETTHVTRTAERMDILVDEVIQNYSFSCSLSSGRTDSFERDSQSFTSNRKYYTPLLQALTNANMYYNNHDEDKSSDTKNSNVLFHETPEMNKANDIRQDTQQQCPSTSKLNYPRPPPEFKLIYE